MHKWLWKIISSMLQPALAGGISSNSVNTLRKEVAALQANGQGSAEEWAENCSKLAQLIQDGDPANFITWPLIRNAMFPYGWKEELDGLRALPDYVLRWKPAIKELSIGTPLLYHWAPYTSGNSVHLAYHIAELARHSGIDVSMFDTIFEMGGGYGNMARIIANLGFSGEYVIFDFPHFAALQKFYLTNAQNGMSAERRPHYTWLTSQEALEEGRTEFADSSTGNKLFIATWSLSESPLEVREWVLPMMKSADAVLIGYQAGFEGLDNLTYFEELGADLEMNIATYEIPHLKDNFYFIGWR